MAQIPSFRGECISTYTIRGSLGAIRGGHPLRARAPVRRDASKTPRRAGARGKVARTTRTRCLTRGIARLPPVQTTEPFVDVRPLSRGAPGGRPLWTLRKGKPTTQRDATSCVRVARSSRRRKSLHSSRSRPGRAWQGCCLVETARLAPPLRLSRERRDCGRLRPPPPRWLLPIRRLRVRRSTVGESEGKTSGCAGPERPDKRTPTGAERSI